MQLQTAAKENTKSVDDTLHSFTTNYQCYNKKEILLLPTDYWQTPVAM
jgi:hypothetical protein